MPNAIMEKQLLKNKIFKRLNKYVEETRFKGDLVHDITLSDFYNIIDDKTFEPVFVLSTGRTGTSFLTLLLNKSKEVSVFHSPEKLLFNSKSELSYQSKIVYGHYSRNGINVEGNELIGQIYLSNRLELLYNCYRFGKTFIETNNRISFFAPALFHLFPKAKFIFVHRHPGDFVRSGIRRSWYTLTDPQSESRIYPSDSDVCFEKWGDFSQLERISWLWNSTNKFILEFLGKLPRSQVFTFNFSSLNPSTMRELLTFIKISDLSPDIIEKQIEIPRNVQRKNIYPEYPNWDRKDKELLGAICGELCDELGHKL